MNSTNLIRLSGLALLAIACGSESGGQDPAPARGIEGTGVAARGIQGSGFRTLGIQGTGRNANAAKARAAEIEAGAPAE